MLRFRFRPRCCYKPAAVAAELLQPELHFQPIAEDVTTGDGWDNLQHSLANCQITPRLSADCQITPRLTADS